MARTSRLDVPLSWYPWPPLDWKADRHFQRLSWAEKGLARELMDECYLARQIPAAAEALAEHLAADVQEVRDLLPRLMRWFVASEDGGLSCPWIENVRANQDQVRLRQSQRRTTATRGDGVTVDDHGAEGEERTEEKSTGEGREDGSGAEPDSPASAPSGLPLSLPCKGAVGTVWEIPSGVWSQWEVAFPKLDIFEEVMKMRAWLNANPRKQKARGNTELFAFRWLSRATVPGAGAKQTGGRSSQPATRTPGLDEDFLDQLKQPREDEDGGVSAS